MNLRHLSLLVIVAVTVSCTIAGCDENPSGLTFERRLNRMMCTLRNALSAKVTFPRGYYLKVSGPDSYVSLHDKQGRILIAEDASHFFVKEPYVVIWGAKNWYFLNTDTGKITIVAGNDHRGLDKMAEEANMPGFYLGRWMTFWDITTGYKPVTWTQK